MWKPRRSSAFLAIYRNFNLKKFLISGHFLSEKFAHHEAIIAQINLFNSLRNKDEFNYSANDVDLNSHIDIFHEIYSQVALFFALLLTN